MLSQADILMNKAANVVPMSAYELYQEFYEKNNYVEIAGMPAEITYFMTHPDYPKCIIRVRDAIPTSNGRVQAHLTIFYTYEIFRNAVLLFDNEEVLQVIPQIVIEKYEE